jgi:hypothetical protein
VHAGLGTGLILIRPRAPELVGQFQFALHCVREISPRKSSRYFLQSSAPSTRLAGKSISRFEKSERTVSFVHFGGYRLAGMRCAEANLSTCAQISSSLMFHKQWGVAKRQ